MQSNLSTVTKCQCYHKHVSVVTCVLLVCVCLCARSRACVYVHAYVRMCVAVLFHYCHLLSVLSQSSVHFILLYTYEYAIQTKCVIQTLPKFYISVLKVRNKTFNHIGIWLWRIVTGCRLWVNILVTTPKYTRGCQIECVYTNTVEQF